MNKKSSMKLIARKLRSAMTKHETIIWSYIRRKQIGNVQFYRQKVLGSYVVDFYAPEIKLVLEIDGSQHFETEHINRDIFRDNYLKESGITVVRFNNLEIMKNRNEVLDKLHFVIKELKELYKSPVADDGPL